MGDGRLGGAGQVRWLFLPVGGGCGESKPVGQTLGLDFHCARPGAGDGTWVLAGVEI